MIISNKKYTFLNIAIALFFLASPIESISIFEGFSIAKLSALFVVIGWATQGFKRRYSTMINSFVVMALYATASIIWSIDRSGTTNQVIMFLWPSIIVSMAMFYSIRKNEDIYLYLSFFIIGCVIAAISTLMFRDATLAAAEYAGQDRLTAFGQDQNTLAFLLCIGFTIVLNFFRKNNKSLQKYISVGMLFVFVIVILSTGSRTGLILTFLVFSLYLISSGSFKNILLMITLVIVLAPLVYNYIPESIWERFLQTNDLVESGNFSERGDIWSAGLLAFKDENFLFGVGYSNFSTMLHNHFGWQMASHNTYLSYLIDFGYCGFFFFIFILIRMTKIVIRIYTKSKDIYIFAYLLPFLIVMFVLETEYKRWIFMYGVLFESYYKLNSNLFKSKIQIS